MKNSNHILVLLAAVLFSANISLSGCSKSEEEQALSLNSEQRIASQSQKVSLLDHNLVISFAKDGSTDITANFAELTFYFSSISTAQGNAHVFNGLLAVTGNWSIDQDERMKLSYPVNILQQLSFMNREWVIAGNTSAELVLTAANGAEVHFVASGN